MANVRDVPKPPEINVEYENLDTPPRYVEGVQGLITPKGAVQVYFYSDLIVPPQEIETSATKAAEGTADLQIKIEDPYSLSTGSIHIVRRIEANLILPIGAVQDLHNWTAQFLQKQGMNGEASEKKEA